MKTIAAIIILTLALALNGCLQPYKPKEDTVPGTSTPSVFQTKDHGVLVQASTKTLVADWKKPEWSTQAVAWAEFKRPNGNKYTVLVYEKKKSESFEDWLQKGEAGDPAPSPITVKTKNGFTGYVYTSDSWIGLPNIHITVPTERFVYYFHWNEGLPENREEAVKVIKEQNLKFEVPQDFLDFVREIEVTPTPSAAKAAAGK